MDAQILRELETAAQILLATPNLVTNEQRQAAECVFINFKKTSSPYNLCIQLLETSKVDYVLFEVAGLLKDALIREWTFLQESDIISLRQYLLKYVIERPTLPPFVREKILQVIAIIVKRGSIDDFGCHRELLLSEIEKLIIDGNHAQKLLGCSLLFAIIQEYAVTTKSSDIGLSVETHLKAKHSFGAESLKRIFQFCCKALISLGNAELPFSNEAQALIKQLLSISEAILTWDFVNNTSFYARYRNADLIQENVSFTPGPSWKDVILDPQVLNLFFMVYWKIRLSPQLFHHVLTCLVQFGTADPYFKGSEEKEYLENYVRGFLKLITSIEILDREAWSISNIVQKTFLRACTLPNFEPKLYQEFLEQVTILTCNFAEGAANEETISAEDRLYMEAFDHMMELWVNVLYEPYFFLNDPCLKTLSSGYLKHAFRKIFDVYLKCHLSPPEGTRGQGRDLELKELDESDESDRVKFQTQLQTIGNFGQGVPDHCLPLLSRLFETKTKTLSNYMDRLLQYGPTISDSSALVSLFEDIHWLLLISGNVIFLTNSVQLRQIPAKIMEYSIAHSSATDIELGLQIFGSPNREFEDFEGAEQKTDLVIRLVSAVFRLSHVFKKFTEAKLTQFLSPEVVSSILWFFKNWSSAYLLMNESYYTEISMPIISAFGRDTEGGAWAVKYLLEQVIIYCIHFSSELGVTQDALKLFISLMRNKEKAIHFLKSESLPSIINIQPRLPEAVKRDVYSGLVLAAIACQDEPSRSEYWQRILKPLQDRVTAIVGNKNFNEIYQEEQVRTEIIEILDCFHGAVLGIECEVTAEGVFRYINPILAELPGLVRVYCNYQQVIEIIFGLLNDCALYIAFSSQSHQKRVSEFCISAIQTYVKCNVGRFSLTAESEEDTFNDISLLLKLLKNLLHTCDYFDTSNLDATPESDQRLMTADVCLYGLNLIIPLMTAKLFEYPPLYFQYFQFLANLSEMHPEKICQLPDDLLKKILTSVEVGLTTFNQDLLKLCCDFLQSLAAHICTMDGSNQPGRDSLRPFLKLLIDLTLSQQINTGHVHTVGPALFALVCCYQQDYQSLVQSLVMSQPNPVIGERLAKAFTSLANKIPLKYEKKHQHLFMGEFDDFIAKVHGFLHVK